MATSFVEGYQLSPQQQRLWSIQAGTAGAFNTCCLLRIEGPLDVMALGTAVTRLVERHEILRTRFQCVPGMSAPLQVILKEAAVEVEEVDLSGADAGAEETSLAELFEDAKTRKLDLERGPLLHVSEIVLGEGRWALLLASSALCLDRSGLINVARDLIRIYGSSCGGDEPQAVDVQYADLSEWQLQLLDSPEAEPGRRRWTTLASPATTRRPLEADTGADLRPRVLAVPMAEEVEAALGALCRRSGVELGAMLDASWRGLLERLGALREGVLGVLHQGRRHEELRDVPGLLARYLPERLTVEPGTTWLELARRSSTAFAEAEAWQEFYEPESDGSRYFGACFELVEVWAGEEVGGVRFGVDREWSCIDRFDVKLVCERRGERVSAALHYDGGRYERAEVERLAARWAALLRGAVAHPERPLRELEILGQEERRQVLEGWSGNPRRYGREGSVVERIAAQAAAHPERPAVECEGAVLRYGELEGRARRLAEVLWARGVGRESRVGLCVPRSLEMVVGLLGILKSGAGYVALDPSHPLERLTSLLEDSGAELLLGLRRSSLELPSSREVLYLDEAEPWPGRSAGGGGEPEIDPGQLAYVVYTSGSTGRPKGVLVEHRQLLNYVQAVTEGLGLDSGSRFGLVTTYAADLGYTMLYPALCSGGCVEVVSEERAGDAAALAELFESRPVEYLKIVPSHLRALLSGARAERLLPRRGLVMGGEACEWDLVRQVRELSPACRLWNHYGPTEATVGVLCGEVPAESGGSATAPLGRPLGNQEVYVLDGVLRPVPVGVEGELYLGGAGLARGYLGRPRRTAEVFVPHPFAQQAGVRLYRTGDLGRWLEGGLVEFLGRADDQVKIRGYRVELGEVEAALRAHPGVRDAAVVTRDLGAGEPRLVAYVAAPESEMEADGSRYLLPNGMAVAHRNRVETEQQYREIFDQQVYLRLGARLGPDGCVVDAGANIGMFSLFASQCCPGGRVYAFEPIGELSETLSANAGRYGGNVRVFAHGLGEREEEREFVYYPRYSMFSGMRSYSTGESERELLRSFLEPLLERAGSEAGEVRRESDELLDAQLVARSESCRLRPLSAVVREEGIERIDLLKIDVQGAEREVLAGIAEEDWGRIRQIVMEVHDETPGAERLGEVLELLRTRGYRVEVEQDERLQAGGRYDLYAVRRDEEGALASWGASAGIVLPQLGGDPGALSSSGLRSSLAERLPVYMVPHAIVLLPRLPRTPNGKLDRQALPAPELKPAGGKARPLTPLEEVIAGVWSEVLQRSELVGPEESFFDLGGHSLLATQVTSRLRAALGLEVPVVWLFDAPTVAGLARRIERHRRQQEGLLPPPLVPVPRDRPLPLSFAQQRLWFLDQWNPGSAFYNIDSAVRIGGHLKIVSLARALNLLVARHEMLRTIFPAEQGRPMQVILPALHLELPIADLRALPEDRREAAALDLAVDTARRSFDLSRGPLLRAGLVRLGDDDHVLLLTLHHIISDGWSTKIMISEFLSFYEACCSGVSAALPPLPIQYADYASWQRQWLVDEVLESHLAYWRERLASAPLDLELRTDLPRPSLQRFRGRRRSVELDASLVEEVRSLARRSEVTLFTLLLAAFQVLLRRYTVSDRIPVGTNSANRNHLDVEGIIGFFVNQLVLVADLSTSPRFRDLLESLREEVLGAFEHQELPFEKLVAELRPERNTSHSPLYQVLFTLQPPADELEAPAGLTFESFPIPHAAAKLDLVLTMVDLGPRMIASLEYNIDLFTARTVDRMLEQYTCILREVVANPEVSLRELLDNLARVEVEAANRESETLRSSDRERLSTLKKRRRPGGRSHDASIEPRATPDS